MLYIWSTAETALLNKTFASVLRSFRPEVPEHKFVELMEGLAPPELVKGDIGLACGNRGLDALRAAGIAPKNRSLSTLRETPFAHPYGGAFMLTFDPWVTTQEFEKKEIIEWDTRLAVRLMRTGSLKPRRLALSSVTDLPAKTSRASASARTACDTITSPPRHWCSSRAAVFTAEPK